MGQMVDELLQRSSGEAAVATRAKIKKLASPVTMATPVLKIATFHSSSLGALVASLPALVTLRDSFPGARLCPYVRAPLLPLLECFRACDEAHARPGGGLSSQAALMARLHAGNYDLAISFSQGSNALLLMWATGAPVRAGFVPSRMDALLTHKTRKSGPLRPLDALELARCVGATSRGERARDWLDLPPTALQRAHDLREAAGLHGDFLVVTPEARRAGEGASRRVKSGGAVDAATLRELAERFSLAVVGLKSARALVEAAGAAPHPIADFGGRTDVLTLAALCAQSRGVFGVGSGPLHFGKLFDKPIAWADDRESAAHALATFEF